MSKLEQYGHNFQIKTLSSLIKDKEFLQQVADIVSPDFFDNEANKWIISKTLEYFNEFRTTPTMEVFKVEVEKILDEEDDVNDRQNAVQFRTLMKAKGYCFFFKTC